MLFGINLMSVLLVFLAVSAVVSLGLNAAAIITHTRTSFFLGGIACALLALVPIVTAIALGLGNWAAIDYYNGVPFVLFMSLFFIPAAIMLALIGIFEPDSDPLEGML